MAKKKKQTTTLIHAHPATPANIITPVKPRRLAARRAAGGYPLNTGALDIGFVPGDLVTGTQGKDGFRYIDGSTQLRRGTLTGLLVAAYFCHCHGPEVIDQIMADWRGEGAILVEQRGGVVHGFWPEKLPFQDAAVALERSAAEFNLPPQLVPYSDRRALITQCADLTPFLDPDQRGKWVA